MDSTCEKCRFFWIAQDGLGSPIVACRRYPPIAKGGWARVDKSNWCGEFQHVSEEHGQ